MSKKVKQVFFFLVTMTLFFACQKKFDKFYERPDTLDQPIYQQLQAKGKFGQFLKLIDKAGYKQTLSTAGYWTLFAPHDSAVTVYLTQNSIASVDAIDSASARKIVTYCLVYNAFKQERISDFQSNLGWVENAAFKRRTANYTGVYDAVNLSGTPIKAIASNRNTIGTFSYVDADNNNKHIPIFETGFMTGKTLTATDYNYFYPTSTYTGFNVADAKVVEKDIAAENGVIHVVDRVITSLPSIDQYIGSNPKYSEFKKLMDRFLVAYVLNQTVTQNYKNIYGTSTDVYTKVFVPNIAFSPNNENFLKQQDNDAQSDTYTMFVPENATLLNYINTVLLEHYPTVESLPVNIIYDFMNAHMWRTAVWPSKFASTFNSVGEEARFNALTDITDKKVLSNGIFYGTNKVQDANVFSSVYGKAYLNPAYSMMTGLLNLDLKFQISNIYQNYTLFLVSNAALNAAGYRSDPTVSNNVNEQWRYTPPNGGADVVGLSALVRLQRILNMHVIPGRDITSAIAPGVAQSYSGEFIKFNDNQVVGAGNGDFGTTANVVDKKTAKNGTVYYLDKILQFSDTLVGRHIQKLGTTPTPATSQYNSFYQYLLNSTIFNASTREILQVASGSFYTFFIPDNAAILKAVNDGYLPGTGTAPNKVPLFNPPLAADKEKVANFIYYHILNKKNIATDGQESGTFETIFKFPNGDPSSIFVNNSTPNSIILNDMMSRSANVIQASSNQLSNRCTIHLINNYLRYN
ncbi:fasciclin domain-containing protein [Lacibacter sediminis]|uniref:Fasciclin domain-containing protein n=1 Tax=Lacibacter sediminis TaxID=2760713 RepID=A0A7G5XAZ8_9BACT|nr:fasciclin domain-containing protein [Lacibacter sediminis]QNA42651.1 fasciclin domain-containing protein [Lacibacter sediminis]